MHQAHSCKKTLNIRLLWRKVPDRERFNIKSNNRFLLEL